jgi:hypothetical protein
MTDAQMIHGLMALQEQFMLAGDDSHDELLSQAIARIMYLPKQVDKMLHPTNSIQDINKVIQFIWGAPE